MNTEVYDLIIVGAGPVGLFSAYYAGLRQMKVKVLESLSDCGGQLLQLYPEKTIKDIAGFPEVAAKDFIAQLKKQLQSVSVTFEYNQEVLMVKKNESDIFEIKTKFATHLGKAVLLTTGGGAFTPRKLTITHDDTLEGEKIFYQATDLEPFKDQTVAVLGGGDSAVDWALDLEKVAKKVYVIHRREQFRALEHSITQLKESSVDILTPYVAKDLMVNDTISLSLRQVKTKENLTLEVDKLLVSYGFVNTRTSFTEDSVLTDQGKFVVSSNQETSLKGMFACGDAAIYPGKVQLIATGLGEAPTAVNNIFAYLNPNERLQPVHSTSC